MPPKKLVAGTVGRLVEEGKVNPGTDRLEHLVATELALSPAEIDEAASKIELTGARLDEGLLALSES